MNIFEEFSLSRELTIKEGEIMMDLQRIVIFPTSFIGQYVLKIKDDKQKSQLLYECMKAGMIKYSKPLGKEYALSYRDFLDRWIKYCAFGGWGLVKYQIIEEQKNYGVLTIKNMPLHLYLKNKGVHEPVDPLFDGLIAGSLSGTFNTNIEVIETKCVCSGNEECVYYWGTKEYLRERFPELISKKLGD